MEQLSLLEQRDAEVDNLLEAISTHLTDHSVLGFLKVKRIGGGIISVCAQSRVCFKTKLSGKAKYLEVKKKHEYMLSKHSSSKAEWARVPIESFSDVLEYACTLSSIFSAEVKELAGEAFGCCARYTDCSNALRCLHPNNLRSLACQYRKNLEGGRIFYGVNRNI